MVFVINWSRQEGLRNSTPGLGLWGWYSGASTPGLSPRAAGSRLVPYTKTEKPGGRLGQAGEREREGEILDICDTHRWEVPGDRWIYGLGAQERGQGLRYILEIRSISVVAEAI